MSRESPALAPPRDALHNLCLADPVWAERYEGWTELGHGGSASVVRTHGKALGEDLALKIFPRLSAEDWRRFQEEVRNAQRLTSAHIVRTYSPFPRGTFAWIELELIEGPNLRQELERRTREAAAFPIEEALEIGIAVASALVAAHDAGVVHRDVKPANILLPRGGRPVAKLGDFGISRLAGAARLTKTGLLAGTPQFAAPEVIAGRMGGPPADVYSFALCLYLVLSGNRFPFGVSDEASPTQWLRAHADESPLPIRRLNPNVPGELADLVGRGLSKDPERRPTAPELLTTLRGLRGEEGVAIPRPQRRAGRGRILAAAGVVFVLILGGYVAWPARRAASLETVPVAAPHASPSPVAAPATVEASASPVPVPPPSAAPRAQAAFRASLRGDMMTIVNTSPEPVADVRLTLVASGGGRYTAHAAALEPGEAVYIALDEFTPAPPAHLTPERLEVAGGAPSGRRSASLPLR